MDIFENITDFRDNDNNNNKNPHIFSPFYHSSRQIHIQAHDAEQ